MKYLSQTAQIKKFILEYMEEEKVYTFDELTQAILKNDPGFLDPHYNMLSTVLYQMTKKDKTILRCDWKQYKKVLDTSADSNPENTKITAAAMKKYKKILPLIEELTNELSSVSSHCTPEEYESFKKIYRKVKKAEEEIRKAFPK